MCNIIINALGISNSGGITVLNNLLNKCITDNLNNYYVICNKNDITDKLINKFSVFKNLYFKVVSNTGFLYRFCYENIFLIKFVNRVKANLIYNFSGSRQFFLKIPQITKVHNLIFYSKRLDDTYKRNSQLILWIKQVYLKRLFFKFILGKSKYIEIQSIHVKSCLLDFINIKEKSFYLISDIDVSKSSFLAPRNYDLSKKIKFLYVVGPHFEYPHKNLLDFTNAMLEINQLQFDFEINITLTKDQLSNSKVWDTSLNTKTNFLGYIDEEDRMKELFSDNTILISTSVIETLGLHVIEAIKSGVIAIAPNEDYAKDVYGENMFKYTLFKKNSLINAIKSVINYKDSYNKRILSIQDDLRKKESSKFGSILDVFNEVKNVQK